MIRLNDVKFSVQWHYERTLTVVGAVLLIWVGFMEVFPYIYLIASETAYMLFTPLAAEIIDSVMYDIMYLAIFMVPASFFFLIDKKRKPQPMRLGVRLTGDTFALLLAGLACAFALSYLNSIVMNFFSIPEPIPPFTEVEPYMEDYSIILQFIMIALVPAFCEEFLFRGVILSNLMPYGKATAIVISSVLFGFMHGNFYQFLYTVAGGIVIGTVYVLTDSIWCSIIIHMINNSIAVLQESVLARLESAGANIVISVIEGIIFAAGILCAIYLLYKYRKPEEKNKYDAGEKRYAGVFGKTLSLESLGDTRAEIPAREAVKFFFNPLIMAFMVYSLVRAVMVLFMM